MGVHRCPWVSVDVRRMQDALDSGSLVCASVADPKATRRFWLTFSGTADPQLDLALALTDTPTIWRA